MAVSANRLELLQIADAVAREKSISRESVLSFMEDSMQKAARSRYGQETEVRAEGLRIGALHLTEELENARQAVGMDLHDQTLADLTRILPSCHAPVLDHTYPDHGGVFAVLVCPHRRHGWL